MSSLPKEKHDELLMLARQARERAYCPYSNYAVGAAVQLADGTNHSGCNVENASFGLSICAERSALFAAVQARGEVKVNAIAILAGPVDASEFADAETFPCGACLQVLAEFAGPECRIICAEIDSEGVTPHRVYTLEDLLPRSFDSG